MGEASAHYQWNANVTFDYANKSLLVDAVISRQNSTVRHRSTRTFDNVNRLTMISNNAGGIAVSKHVYTYNTASQRTKATLVDGSHWNYTYDLLGQVSSGKKRWADDTYVEGQQFEYTYDDIGNHTGESSGGDRWGRNLRNASYTANGLNQFSSRTVSGEVDIIGTANSSATVTANTQPTQRKGEYFRAKVPVNNASGAAWASITNIAVLNNGTNSDTISTNIGKLLIEPSEQNFSYDADGNLTNDGVWQYTWDAENRLTAVEPTDAVRTAYPNDAVKMRFTYDWKGRRIQKRKQVWNSNVQTYLDEYFQRFLYDEWSVLAVIDQNHNLLSSYVWGLDLSGTLNGAGGVGGLVAVNTVTNGYHFSYYDGNGNVAGLVSATNSSKTAEFEYDPFGRQLRVTGPAAKSLVFRFSSKYHDTETGCDYYGYRYLKGKKWLSRDPIGEADTANLYTFCRNGPESFGDTDGRLTFFLQPNPVLIPRPILEPILQPRPIPPTFPPPVPIVPNPIPSPNSSPNPGDPNADPNFKIDQEGQKAPHAGEFHVQRVGAKDWKPKVIWRRLDPPTKREGHGFLDSLYTQIGPIAQKNLEKQFKQAHKFVDSAPGLGYGPINSKSWYGMCGYRLDVEIQTGRAFINNPPAMNLFIAALY